MENKNYKQILIDEILERQTKNEYTKEKLEGMPISTLANILYYFD